MKKLVLSLLIVLMSAAAQAQTPTYWASCDSEDRSISFDRETYIDHSEGKKIYKNWSGFIPLREGNAIDISFGTEFTHSIKAVEVTRLKVAAQGGQSCKRRFAGHEAGFGSAVYSVKAILKDSHGARDVTFICVESQRFFSTCD